MAESNSFKFGIIVILGLVALFFIYWFINSRNKKILMQESYANQDDDEQALESFGNIKDSGTLEDRMAHSQNYPPTTTKPMNSDLVGEDIQSQYNDNPSLQQLRQAACFPKEMLTPEELKPQDNSSLWAQVNPDGEGSLKGRSFLQAGHHIGINTVGQTLRNANLQLRSEPPNPQVLVSPWNQTTIEPDTGRKPLEIGGCA
jgi:hypothetical protein